MWVFYLNVEISHSVLESNLCKINRLDLENWIQEFLYYYFFGASSALGFGTLATLPFQINCFWLLEEQKWTCIYVRIYVTVLKYN